MTTKLLLSILFVSAFAWTTIGVSFSQINPVDPISKKLQAFISTPTLNLPKPNMEAIRLEDEQRDRNGELYRIAVAAYTNTTLTNSGAWTTQPNGDKIWQLHVYFPDAEALSFLFSKFMIYDNARFDVFNTKGERVHKTFTKGDVLEHFQQHLALCFGDEMTLQLVEPLGTQPSTIEMDRIMYGYRSTGNPSTQKINESEACEINVNCTPVGDVWQDEKRGVARILVVDGSSQGWCTGTLTNNTSLDCKPLFLTALHCGITSTTANFNQWRFYFRYEATGCSNPGSAGTLDDNFITGCVKLSSSNDNGGDSGSDFLLVQLGTLANQATTITTLKSANFNAYWNGWDVNNTATTGGAGIHHPAGDIKKISTFNGTTSSTSWGGSVANTHWILAWSSNSNGHGVTEGGSSGSPLFNNMGRQVGTLTGGSSFCSSPTNPDLYGKMSFHWTSNGASDNEQLRTHLDPINTGVFVLNGSANPCTSTPTGPCTAASTDCDEFIQNVTLNTINNTTACSNYASYSSPTSINKGQAYTLTIVPQTGTTIGQAYTNDEIAAWIDWNDDADFDDIGERIAYVLVAAGWSNVFNFTVPTGGVTGQVAMRVRISYLPNDGAITPCGTTQYGEVEDYVINVQQSAGVDENNALEQVSIFPNPTSSNISIDLSSLNETQVSISVIDITGKVIFTEKNTTGGVVTLDMTRFAKGTYQIRLEDANFSSVKRVVRM